MDEKYILDACCGGKMFWFDKSNKNTLFIDNRKMDRQVIWKSKDGKEIREFEVKPDIVADFTNLPFADETFYHVVFDPPHLITAGKKSWLAAKYGRLDKDWEDMIRKGFSECFRVLRPLGTLVFKWNENDIKVSEVLKLCEYKPLYGHVCGKGGKTHWLVFFKEKNQEK